MAWLKKKFQGAMEKWEKDDGKVSAEATVSRQPLSLLLPASTEHRAFTVTTT